MHSIQFDDNSLDVNEDDSLLDQLLDAGYDIPHACKQGICHSCVMQASAGTIPEASQKGLSDEQIANNFFMSCQCHPCSDMSVNLPKASESLAVEVDSILPVSDTVLSLKLTSQEPFEYKAGQFVNLIRDDGLTRSYSLASVPGVDSTLDFHIRVLEGGKFSEWAKEELFDGDMLSLQGPFGDCYYDVSSDDQPMLMAATGTGLAPLYGIIRSAINDGHSGKISLYMGARDAKGLYFVKQLQALADKHDNIDYIPVLSTQGDKDPDNAIYGDLIETINSDFDSLEGYSLYLCGAPQLVNSLVELGTSKGAERKDIHHDAFVPTS